MGTIEARRMRVVNTTSRGNFRGNPDSLYNRALRRIKGDEGYAPAVNTGQELGLKSTQDEIDNQAGIEHIVTQRWNTRFIRPEDIVQVAKWFQNKDVPNHIYDDHINPFIPTSWKNKGEIARFIKGLSSFYFSQKPFRIETKIPKEAGRPQSQDKTVLAERVTHVVTLNGKPVGVQSWLTNDPYAPQEDRDKIDKGELKVAYGHAMITDPENRKKGIALFMTAQRADRLLGKTEEEPGEFNQISTLINLNGKDWGKVIEFFTRFGYTIDRRSLEQIPQKTQDGEQVVQMFRYLITANDWHKKRPEIIQTIQDIMGIEYDKK